MVRNIEKKVEWSNYMISNSNMKSISI